MLGRRFLSGLTFVCAFALSACAADELTQIVVVIDSELVAPIEVDNVTLDAVDSSGTTHTATATVGGLTDSRFPLTIGIVPGTDKNAAVTVRVDARDGSSSIVEIEGSTRFIEGRSLMLRLLIPRGCSGTAAHCAAGMTCSTSRAACMSSFVDPSNLASWEGAIPPRDGGVSVDASTPMDMGVLPDSAGTDASSTDAAPTDGSSTVDGISSIPAEER